jgi:hypothetical protein
LRPGLDYLGIDSSDYVVRRFGKKRNIRKASFGDLESLGLAQRFGLVVCSDVLHYVADDELRRGVNEIVRLTAGVAFIEVLTKEDEIVGDLRDLIRRPTAWYRKTFAEAGLMGVAPHSFVPRSVAITASELAIPG